MFTFRLYIQPDNEDAELHKERESIFNDVGTIAKDHNEDLELHKERERARERESEREGERFSLYFCHYPLKIYEASHNLIT